MISIGSKIPALSLKKITQNAVEDVNSIDLFKNIKCIVIGIPGAFTPVCSTQHVPGFYQRIDEIHAKDIQSVFCISVNDFFTMKAWGESLKILDKMVMLSDFSGNFIKALGLDVDLTEFGLGLRSRRFCMVIDHGIIQTVDVESTPGTCEITSAESFLKKIL